jgi:hypothetical protein
LNSNSENNESYDGAESRGRRENGDKENRRGFFKVNRRRENAKGKEQKERKKA